jgi:hypothetical protein
MEDWIGDAGAELDKMADETPRPAPQDRRKAKPEAKEDEPTPTPEPTKPEETTQGDEVEPQPEAEVAPKPEDVAKMGARDLRKAYEGSQKKIREELQPKVTKLETRIKELESAKPEENGALTEKYKSLEKHNQELEAHIKFVDYKKSAEYKQKYWQPLVDAWERARGDMAEIPATMGDGTTRPANDNDMMTLMALPLGERQIKANEMFGDLSNYMMTHAKEILSLSKAEERALKDAEKNAQAVSEERTVKAREAHQTRIKLWDTTNKEIVDKYPAWFAPREGDAEGNKLLAAGQALTAVLFHPDELNDAEKALLPKFARDDLAVKGQLSQQSVVRIHALINHKASNHDRIARDMKTLRAQLEAAEKKLGEYEESEPPGPGGSQPSRGLSEYIDDSDAEIERLAKQA